MDEKPQEAKNLYEQSNDVVRLSSFCDLDDTITIALRSFFRQIGASHLFDERVAPTLQTQDSFIFAAVRDRPWPPWGHGSQRICSMIQTYPIAHASYGLSPQYVLPEETANIGLRAALYKEVLESLSKQSGAQINYLVVDGSVLADRTLRAHGFKKTKDILLTDEQSKYFYYTADAAELLNHLSLAETSLPELMTHRISDKVLERNALFLGVLDLVRHREIVPIDAGSFEASLPGGVGGGTSGPREFNFIRIRTE